MFYKFIKDDSKAYKTKTNIGGEVLDANLPLFSSSSVVSVMLKSNVFIATLKTHLNIFWKTILINFWDTLVK